MIVDIEDKFRVPEAWMSEKYCTKNIVCVVNDKEYYFRV